MIKYYEQCKILRPKRLFKGSICNFQMSKYVKKGTWKWGNNFTLSPEKVHQVALFYTTFNIANVWHTYIGNILTQFLAYIYVQAAVK